MIRLLLRSRRFRWLIIGSVVRFFARRSAARSVDQATASIEDRLPQSVAKALDAVPADVTRLGGSAVVAGRTARRVANAGVEVGRAADRQVVSPARRASATVTDAGRRIRAARHRLTDDVFRETEHTRRQLTSDYLLDTRGRAAADDALLDRRSGAAGEFDAEPVDAVEPLPEIAPPVRRGRWRASREVPAPVSRVQRTYRRKTPPWAG